MEYVMQVRLVGFLESAQSDTANLIFFLVALLVLCALFAACVLVIYNTYIKVSAMWSLRWLRGSCGMFNFDINMYYGFIHLFHFSFYFSFMSYIYLLFC